MFWGTVIYRWPQSKWTWIKSHKPWKIDIVHFWQNFTQNNKCKRTWKIIHQATILLLTYSTSLKKGQQFTSTTSNRTVVNLVKSDHRKSVLLMRQNPIIIILNKRMLIFEKHDICHLWHLTTLSCLSQK